MPAGVTGSDVMTGLSHCLHMSGAFHLPYTAEPGFAVLNNERGARLTEAGNGDVAQLWVLTTGFEDGGLRTSGILRRHLLTYQL